MSTPIAWADVAVFDLTAWGEGDLQRVWIQLSSEEQAQAQAYGDPARRLEYVAGRAAERQVRASRSADCLINLSHSGSWLVVAAADAACIRALGVDVEVLRPLPAPDAFARRILSVGEAPPPSGLVGAWTAKEAALKALGVGLHGDPRDWTLDWADAAKPRAVAAPAEAGDPADWRFTVFDLEVREARAVATVAARLMGPGELRTTIEPAAFG